MHGFIATLDSGDEGAGDEDEEGQVEDAQDRAPDPSKNFQWDEPEGVEMRIDVDEQAIENRADELETAIRKRRIALEDQEDEYQGMTDDEDGLALDRQKDTDSEVDSDDSSSSSPAQEAARRAFFQEDHGAASSAPTTTFTSFNLERPIQKALTQAGFSQPTPIQAATIPVALLGKDVVAGAVTGSGKTIAFVVPILERLHARDRSVALTRVVILCPTRELAAQCHSVTGQMCTFLDIRISLIVGGLSVKAQEAELRTRPDIVIATPGRLIDHVRNSPGFTLDHIQILVMDEADRMLEEGFEAEVMEIVQTCPRRRQTMLFSATMTETVDELVKLSLHKPVRLMIDPNRTVAKELTQEFIRIRSESKTADDRVKRNAVLLSLTSQFKRRAIIFFNRKSLAHEMRIIFGLIGLKAGELHGNLSQEERSASLERFKNGQVDYLMATDVAARGLDIKGIETVINMDMPAQFSQYLHRVGRTARAGRLGRSITLIGEKDRKYFKMVLKTSTHSEGQLTKSQIKIRQADPGQVSRYLLLYPTLQTNLSQVLEEEKEIKATLEAERDVRRGENLMRHSNEIYGRPARTWFQTKREKEKQKRVGQTAWNKTFGPAKVVQAGESRKDKPTGRPKGKSHGKSISVKNKGDSRGKRPSAKGQVKKGKGKK